MKKNQEELAKVKTENNALKDQVRGKLFKVMIASFER